MTYLLDTDHISLMDRGGAEGLNIQVRLTRVPMDDVSASVISYEEQIRGWMAVIARAPTAERQIPLYAQLRRLLRFYQRSRKAPAFTHGDIRLHAFPKA